MIMRYALSAVCTTHSPTIRTDVLSVVQWISLILIRHSNLNCLTKCMTMMTDPGDEFFLIAPMPTFACNSHCQLAVWATAEIKVATAIKVTAKAIFLMISMIVQAFLLANPTRPSRPEVATHSNCTSGVSRLLPVREILFRISP